MNIVEIAHAFGKGELSLLQTYRKLYALGYTFQEIRRIVKGVVHSVERSKNGTRW